MAIGAKVFGCGSVGRRIASSDGARPKAGFAPF